MVRSSDTIRPPSEDGATGQEQEAPRSPTPAGATLLAGESTRTLFARFADLTGLGVALASAQDGRIIHQAGYTRPCGDHPEAPPSCAACPWAGAPNGGFSANDLSATVVHCDYDMVHARAAIAVRGRAEAVVLCGPARDAAARSGAANDAPSVDVEELRRTAAFLGALARTLGEFGANQQELHESRRALNEQLLTTRELVSRLRSADDDLAHVSALAAHDLGEPVRMVSGYSSLLSKRYGDCLDDEGRTILGYVRDGAEHIRALLGGLLDYMQAATVEESRRFDPRAAVERAVQALGPRIAAGNASIEIDPLPDVLADSRRLERVFHHLLDNALKFRHPDRRCRVRVACATSGAVRVFQVSDNGIGMDEADIEKAFAPFRRLHPYHRFGGAGVGLALCRRAVTAWGGEMWLSSQPGQGTTAWFTVPAPRVPRQ